MDDYIPMQEHEFIDPNDCDHVAAAFRISSTTAIPINELMFGPSNTHTYLKYQQQYK